MFAGEFRPSVLTSRLTENANPKKGNKEKWGRMQRFSEGSGRKAETANIQRVVGEDRLISYKLPATLRDSTAFCCYILSRPRFLGR